MSRAPKPISRIRHNLGESFLFVLDDIRQKLVEEAWTGNTQTPSSVLQLQYSDFVSWLYGVGVKLNAADTAQERRLAGEAIVHAVDNGAIDTMHEIAALSDLKHWCAGVTAPQAHPIDYDQLARTAITHALYSGAIDTAHEIAALSGLSDWIAGRAASAPKPPEAEPEGLEL